MNGRHSGFALEISLSRMIRTGSASHDPLQIKSSAGATIVHRIEAILDVAASRPVAEVLEDVVAAGGEAPQYERGRRQYQVLVRNYKRSIIISTARQWTIAVNDEGRVISCVARDVFVAP